MQVVNRKGRHHARRVIPNDPGGTIGKIELRTLRGADKATATVPVSRPMLWFRGPRGGPPAVKRSLPYGIADGLSTALRYAQKAGEG